MAIPYPENRKSERFDHQSPLQVKDLKSGEIYEARMLNYSDSGISFASNGKFQRGTKIYFCVQKSPYYQSAGILRYFCGEVIWRKELIRSNASYGYGVQLISASETQNSVAKHINEAEYPRKHPRKPFFQRIGFRTDHGIHKGKTKNVSASGVFIATDEKLEVGQTLKLSFPLKNGKKAKIIGQIVWLNEEGFGLKFKKIR